ncbi:MAG: hypothetical protein HYU39_05825 [Thaumarchaeota archaeon]|nr:hypothetical protein [Nitrososphaerota archaeon]
MAASVSRIPVTITVIGRGDAQGEIFRHLAPTTIGALVRSSPLQGRLLRQTEYVSMLTDLKVGVEKGKRSFSKGEIAFFPMNGSICIFLQDANTATPMSPLGKITKGLERLEAISRGEVAKLAVQQPQKS